MCSDSAWVIEPPKDAEGRVIPLDTEVVYSKDGQAYHVADFRYSPKAKEWFVCGRYRGSERTWYDETDNYLLALTDSWEKLIGDLRRAVDSSGYSVECCYLDPEDEGCRKCPANGKQCKKYAFSDIADRIEKLRGASNGD